MYVNCLIGTGTASSLFIKEFTLDPGKENHVTFSVWDNNIHLNSTYTFTTNAPPSGTKCQVIPQIGTYHT